MLPPLFARRGDIGQTLITASITRDVHVDGIQDAIAIMPIAFMPMTLIIICHFTPLSRLAPRYHVACPPTGSRRTFPVRKSHDATPTVTPKRHGAGDAARAFLPMPFAMTPVDATPPLPTTYAAY